MKLMKWHGFNLKYMFKESNAIEGVFGQTAIDQSMDAWFDLVGTKPEVTSQIVKDTHKIMMQGLIATPEDIGEFRIVPVFVGHKLMTDPYKVPALVEGWCQVQREGFPVDALEEHLRFERIHPFIDGNGRTGRLLMNYQRLLQDQSMIVFTKKNVRGYYELFDSDI